MRTLLKISSVLLALISSAPGAQFSISNAAINGGLDSAGGVASYSGNFTNATLPAFGTTGNGGYVGDGGFDAFDGYGYLRNLGALTVQRRVDTFVAQNTYRWLDTFTNSTASTITQTVQFFGDLGSDNTTTTVSATPGLRVTSDSAGTANDPVIAHVSGFTSFAGGTISSAIVNENTLGNWADDYVLSITLTLAPGQSAGILNFVALARDTSAVRNYAGDVTLATTMGQNLLANPILSGLTTGQIGTIRNFATPEPGTLALLAIGITGLVLVHRRRRLALD